MESILQGHEAPHIAFAKGYWNEYRTALEREAADWCAFWDSICYEEDDDDYDDDYDDDDDEAQP